MQKLFEFGKQCFCLATFTILQGSITSEVKRVFIDTFAIKRIGYLWKKWTFLCASKEMVVKSILNDYTTLLLVPLLSLVMLCEYWLLFKSGDVKLFNCCKSIRLCHINHTTCGLEAYQTCQTQKVISYTYFASSSQSDRNSFQIFLTKQVSEPSWNPFLQSFYLCNNITHGDCNCWNQNHCIKVLIILKTFHHTYITNSRGKW